MEQGGGNEAARATAPDQKLRPRPTHPFLAADGSVRSLNRARIVALPGVAGAEAVLGKSGYELLAAAALRKMVAARAAELGLDPAHPDLLRHFNRCFESPQQAALAQQIARAYGQRLGFLLLMLRRGDPASRAARPEWSEAHWAFWRTVQSIWLGGGVLAGRVGPHATDAARELLAAQGHGGLTLALSPHAGYLPLLGMARSAPPGVSHQLVLDFGQSAIKRGVATYRAGQLVHLHVLPSLPSVGEALAQPSPSEQAVRAQWEQMLDVIAASHALVPPAQHAQAAVGIALACYLFDGHPAPHDWGSYGRLQLLCEHLESFTRQSLRARLGTEPPLRLLHDGSAAALAYAGTPNALVLTLGTAIGSGFPPEW